MLPNQQGNAPYPLFGGNFPSMPEPTNNNTNNPNPIAPPYPVNPYLQNNQFNSNERPLNQSIPNSNAHMIFQKYEISPQMTQKLQLLNQYKVVFILDDSGSMNTIDIPANQQYHYNNPSTNMTRWDELLQFVNTSLEIALVFNPQGCDVYFLNRQSIKQCRDLNQLRHVFQNRPSGVTPLTRTIQQVINENSAHVLQGKQLLLIIATDGEPTDIYGQSNIPEFKHCLATRPPNVFTTIVACTNDQNAVGYLNNLDKELPRLDVVDDYKSELAEVKRYKGPQFPFSFGDYIVKSFLGSVDAELDNFDE